MTECELFRGRGLAAAVLAALVLGGCAGSGDRGLEPTAGQGASPGVMAEPVPVVLSSDPWSYQGRRGKLIRTENYRIFTTVQDSPLPAVMPGFFESALANYRRALGPLPAPGGTLDTFVMANRWQWARLTQQLMGDDAHVYLRIERGGYAAAGRAVLYNIGVYDTLALAAHEGWHQYTQRTFAEPLPVWLEEGIATYMEGYRSDPGRVGVYTFLPWSNVERFDQLRAAAARGAGGLVPLEQLLESAPRDLLVTGSDATLTYYAQVWALVHFLREGEDGRYADDLHRLLLDAVNGRISERLASAGGDGSAAGAAVFRVYFNEELEEASRQYERFIRRVVTMGARDSIVQGISPAGGD
jgi:hypothetical protein